MRSGHANPEDKKNLEGGSDIRDGDESSGAEDSDINVVGTDPNEGGAAAAAAVRWSLRMEANTAGKSVQYWMGTREAAFGG